MKQYFRYVSGRTETPADRRWNGQFEKLSRELLSKIEDRTGTALTTTLVLSNFDLGRYNFAWQFRAEASGWHTVTLSADEFMQPFVRRILVFASQVYLPIVLRNF